MWSIAGVDFSASCGGAGRAPSGVDAATFFSWKNSMNPQDRQAIDAVFSRLDDVSRSGSPRDAEAEQYIASQLSQRPGSAYYLAQTVLVQQQALEAAQQRLQQAERAAPGAVQQDDQGFGRFGRSRPVGASAAPAVPPPNAAPSMGFGRSAGGGGGFLAGAAQTAVGVAGGMMLGSLLGGMFGGNDAQAAPAEPAPEPAADEGDAADGGWDDGGDMGDGGDF